MVQHAAAEDGGVGEPILHLRVRGQVRRASREGAREVGARAAEGGRFHAREPRASLEGARGVQARASDTGELHAAQARAAFEGARERCRVSGGHIGERERALAGLIGERARREAREADACGALAEPFDVHLRQRRHVRQHAARGLERRGVHVRRQRARALVQLRVLQQGPHARDLRAAGEHVGHRRHADRRVLVPERRVGGHQPQPAQVHRAHVRKALEGAREVP